MEFNRYWMKRLQRALGDLAAEGTYQKWVPMAVHTVDMVCCCQYLLEQYDRNYLDAVMEQRDWYSSFLCAAALHDIGKICGPVQTALQKGSAGLQGIKESDLFVGFDHHAQLSEWIFSEYGLSDLADLAGMHHDGAESLSWDLKDLWKDGKEEVYSGKSVTYWRRKWSRYVEVVQEQYPCKGPPLAVWKKVFLAGILQNAEELASNPCLFPMLDRDQPVCMEELFPRRWEACLERLKQWSVSNGQEESEDSEFLLECSRQVCWKDQGRFMIWNPLPYGLRRTEAALQMCQEWKKNGSCTSALYVFYNKEALRAGQTVLHHWSWKNQEPDWTLVEDEQELRYLMCYEPAADRNLVTTWPVLMRLISLPGSFWMFPLLVQKAVVLDAVVYEEAGNEVQVLRLLQWMMQYRLPVIICSAVLRPLLHLRMKLEAETSMNYRGDGLENGWNRWTDTGRNLELNFDLLDRFGTAFSVMDLLRKLPEYVLETEKKVLVVVSWKQLDRYRNKIAGCIESRILDSHLSDAQNRTNLACLKKMEEWMVVCDEQMYMTEPVDADCIVLAVPQMLVPERWLWHVKNGGRCLLFWEKVRKGSYYRFMLDYLMQHKIVQWNTVLMDEMISAMGPSLRRTEERKRKREHEYEQSLLIESPLFYTDDHSLHSMGQMPSS